MNLPPTQPELVDPALPVANEPISQLSPASQVAPGISEVAPVIPNSRKPLYIGLFLVGLTILGAGLFLMWSSNNTTTSPLLTDVSASPSPSAKSTASTSVATAVASVPPIETLAITSPLQNFLRTECELKDPTQKGYYVLKNGLASMPLTIDPTLLELKPGADGELATCSSTGLDTLEQPFVTVGTHPSSYYLFDNDSSELGHGGPPMIGIYGTEYYQAGPVTVYININGPHAGPGLVEDIYLELRVVKRFNTQAESLVYFSTIRNLTAPGEFAKNPAAAPFLNTYAKESFAFNGKTIQVAVSDQDLWFSGDDLGYTNDALAAELEKRYPGKPRTYTSEIDIIAGKSTLREYREIGALIKALYPDPKAFLTIPIVQKTVTQIESVRAK